MYFRVKTRAKETLLYETKVNLQLNLLYNIKQILLAALFLSDSTSTAQQSFMCRIVPWLYI